MSTVSREMAERIKAGEYSDEVSLIVEYDNAWGKVAYGTVFHGQVNKYIASEYVGSPRIWWVNPQQQALG